VMVSMKEAVEKGVEQADARSVEAEKGVGVKEKEKHDSKVGGEQSAAVGLGIVETGTKESETPSGEFSSISLSEDTASKSTETESK
jgi:hypothetical protein